MKYVVPAAVFLLMVSVGMSLRPSEVLANLRRMSWKHWAGLVLATFIVPAALGLLLGRILPLNRAEMAGLFFVGAAPGAPLMTRNIAKRGFNMHLAAGYQVWGGLLTPIILPLVVYAAGLLHGLTIWIPPVDVLVQIAEKQFVPLLVGIVSAQLLPEFSSKATVWLNRIGNAVLTVGIIALLWFMREALKGLLTWWLPLGALLLAIGSVLSIAILLAGADPIVKRTLAICNVNRHVGLAILLSGQYLHAKRTVPAIAAYAVIVPFLLGGLSWWFHRQEQLGAVGAV
jgi:predicted Na+-dependent transporter